MSGTGSDNGWLEAAIAWEVCASLHRQYCKGKDALFTTRQSDFVKHAEDARARASHGQASSQPECLTCNDHGAVGNILTAEPCPDCTRKAAPAAVTGSSEAVAYLDIGTGGYLDLGTDLADEALSRLPKGRHALVIAGTYGIDGYIAAPTTQPSPAAQGDALDAARYRWLRNKSHVVHNKTWLGGISACNRDGDFLCRDDALAALDTAIDIARKFAGAFLDGAYLAQQHRKVVKLSNYDVGRLTVFDGLHHVETPVLVGFIRHIEAALRQKAGCE